MLHSNKVYPLVGMKILCGLFGKTRQAFYQACWREDKIHEEQALVIAEVKRIRKDLPRIGTHKLYFFLAGYFQENKIKMGRDKLYALSREQELLN